VAELREGTFHAVYSSQAPLGLSDRARK
jgi:hypothetical protein